MIKNRRAAPGLAAICSQAAARSLAVDRAGRDPCPFSLVAGFQCGHLSFDSPSCKRMLSGA